VGELVAEIMPGAPTPIGGPALPTLTGFENHGGVTSVGPDAAAVAHVVTGVGNGGGDGSEGAWSPRVFGSYLHGPLLARNPGVADLLLGWAVSAPGELGPQEPRAPLAPLDDEEELALRRERLAAAAGSGRRRTGRRRLVIRRS
jgi:CobQ-like glutamine amidotransferase family enzyme